MYDVYTAVLCAVLPCPHEKITIFRGALLLNGFQIVEYVQFGIVIWLPLFGHAVSVMTIRGESIQLD